MSLTLEELAWKINSEGFDYFFRYYMSPDKLPEGLRSLAKDYVKAAEAIEAKMRELGYDLSDYEC
jgi:hypothetical protein